MTTLLGYAGSLFCFAAIFFGTEDWPHKLVSGIMGVVLLGLMIGLSNVGRKKLKEMGTRKKKGPDGEPFLLLCPGCGYPEFFAWNWHTTYLCHCPKCGGEWMPRFKDLRALTGWQILDRATVMKSQMAWTEKHSTEKQR